MNKPSPYCECHRWDQPGGVCAYCTGYTDGWTTETTALRRERDALRLVVSEAVALLGQMPAADSVGSPPWTRAYDMLREASAAGKGVG